MKKLLAALIVVGFLFSTVTISGCGKKDDKKEEKEKKDKKD